MLFALEHGTRRAHLLGATEHPDNSFVAQAARNLVGDLAEARRPIKFLIRDRDAKFTAGFDEVFSSEAIEVIKALVRSPRANAFAERWVRTVRQDCLDHLLVVSRRQLESFLYDYVRHYNQARPHRGLHLAVPEPCSRPAGPRWHGPPP